jgi:hypothetical protein
MEEWIFKNCNYFWLGGLVNWVVVRGTRVCGFVEYPAGLANHRLCLAGNLDQSSPSSREADPDSLLLWEFGYYGSWR